MKSKSVQLSICLILILSVCACSPISLYKKAEVDRTLQVKVLEYCPQDGRSLVNIFATNLSAIVSDSEYLKDTDRDGLSDNQERVESIQLKYNIAYNSRDTDGDGYSDLIAYALGLDTERQLTLAECVQHDTDTDRDLLTDCEEEALGFNPQDPDTDKDGIPDGLELRNNLNAVDALDAGLDFDGDGETNIEEVINNSLVDFNYHLQTLKHKITYKVEAITNILNQSCYEVTVSNIPIVEVSNGNMVKLMFLEMENVQGQEQVNYIRDVTVISSRGLANGHMVVVDQVANQTVMAAVE